MKFLINDPQISKADRIKLLFSYFLQITLIAAIAFAFYRKNWLNAFIIIGILVLTFLPSLIRRSYKVNLPIELDLVVVIFVYASLFLGEIHAYYIKFWWWDLILHASSSILLGFAGFFLVYILNTEKAVSIHLKPFFVALFSFAFAVGIGVLWEIFEFSIDSIFGFNMQKSGLVDTMWDLIVNVLSALFVAIFGFVYLKENKLYLNRAVRWLFKK